MHQSWNRKHKHQIKFDQEEIDEGIGYKQCKLYIILINGMFITNDRHVNKISSDNYFFNYELN